MASPIVISPFTILRIALIFYNPALSYASYSGHFLKGRFEEHHRMSNGAGRSIGGWQENDTQRGSEAAESKKSFRSAHSYLQNACGLQDGTHYAGGQCSPNFMFTVQMKYPG